MSWRAMAHTMRWDTTIKYSAHKWWPLQNETKKKIIPTSFCKGHHSWSSGSLEKVNRRSETEENGRIQNARRHKTASWASNPNNEQFFSSSIFWLEHYYWQPGAPTFHEACISPTCHLNRANDDRAVPRDRTQLSVAAVGCCHPFHCTIAT